MDPIDNSIPLDIQERVAPSVSFSDDNHFQLFYITSNILPIIWYPEWCADPFRVRMMERNDTGWKTFSLLSYENISLTYFNFTSKDIESVFDFFSTVSTSLATDSEGTPYIAYTDSFSKTQIRTFGVSTKESKGSWSPLIFDQIKPETHNFSLAIGPNDRPIVAYTDESTHITMVLEWNGSSKWDSIGEFPAKSDAAPSIRQDTDKNAILACTQGVKKYKRIETLVGAKLVVEYRWEDLGNPGYGQGDPSWWIGTNDNIYAVAYVNSDKKVSVKIRHKND
jgi:hypothetical protein